jgi:hypothetical protein
MTTFNNPTDDEMIRALGDDAARARELPVDPDAEERARLLDALHSGRPLTITFPGDVETDAHGRVGISENNTYAVGIVAAVHLAPIPSQTENDDTREQPGEV